MPIAPANVRVADPAEPESGTQDVPAAICMSTVHTPFEHLLKDLPSAAQSQYPLVQEPVAEPEPGTAGDGAEPLVGAAAVG